MDFEREPRRQSAQALVDALSVALGRSVLLDDPALVPLAHSRQWDVDEVRSTSILSRGPSGAVREALFDQGIAAAADIVHTPPDPELGMEARVCMPVRDGGQTLGYIWILDPREELGADELERVRSTAAEISAVLARSSRREIGDEAELVEQLRSPDPHTRERAAAVASARHLLGEGPAIVCLVCAGAGAGEPVEAARRAVRRLSIGQALAATVPEGAALVASLGDPVLRTLSEDEIAAWLRTVAAAGAPVGQSAPTPSTALDEGFRQAGLALRVARRRPSGVAAWETLGADRLLVQLPPTITADLPARLARFLREEPVLVETLTAFLDAGGDVKATATALSLHRSGLYYRLQRIQELSGLDLDDGDDRLLAHLAIRAERLF